MSTESMAIHALKETMGFLDKHRTLDAIPLRMLVRHALETMQRKYPDMQPTGKPIPHPYAAYESAKQLIEA